MSLTLSSRLFPKARLLYQIRSSGTGHWNKDWQPGPYPKTEEERLAAAKKYNLLPHEYEPYKEDDLIIVPGDYPKLPNVSEENKDIYYPWDYPDERRNYGEPMHLYSIFYQEDRVDSHILKKFKYSPLQMFAGLAGAVGFIVSMLFFEDFRFFPPVAARQFPKEGVTNYSYPK